MKIQFKNTIKQFIMFVMVLVMVLFVSENMQVKKAYAAGSSFEQLKAKYPSGSIWTGSYKNKAWECHGFACILGDALTGKDPYTWNKVYNLDSLKAGDIIRCKRPHSIIVTSVSGNTITYADCNWVGKNKVKWDQTILRSQITSKFGKSSYVMSAPVMAYDNNNDINVKPSITNVGIDSIDSSHITFHFTANNAALAKILIESRNTGKSISYSYTSGLNHISHTFYTSTLPGTTEINLRIYAYTTVNGGNETLHNVLYGDTPNVVKFPQKTSSFIEEICFDPVYYADNNADIKAAFGYDREKLYNHWKTMGIFEGRASSPIWDPMYYLKANADLKIAYGNDYTQAYQHFSKWGYKEYRISSVYYDGNFYKNLYYGEFKNMDSKALLHHFKEYGLGENRQAGSDKYTGNSSWK